METFEPGTFYVRPQPITPPTTGDIVAIADQLRADMETELHEHNRIIPIGDRLIASHLEAGASWQRTIHQFEDRSKLWAGIALSHQLRSGANEQAAEYDDVAV